MRRPAGQQPERVDRRRTRRCPRSRGRRAGSVARPARRERRGDARELGLVLEQAPRAPRAARGSPRGTARPGAGGCGRGSAGDTRLASDEHALDLEAVVERRRRRPGSPGSSRPTLGEPEHARRHRRRRPRARPRAGTPSACEVADRLDHRQRAAGEHAVRRGGRRRRGPRPRARRGRTRRRRAPAPAIASVTSATPARAPPPDEPARSSGARWTPSRMIWTTTSGRASAAPTMPGSRWQNGRIALNRCVTVRTPRSKAAFASLGGRVGVAAARR